MCQAPEVGHAMQPVSSSDAAQANETMEGEAASDLPGRWSFQHARADASQQATGGEIQKALTKGESADSVEVDDDEGGAPTAEPDGQAAGGVAQGALTKGEEKVEEKFVPQPSQSRMILVNRHVNRHKHPVGRSGHSHDSHGCSRGQERGRACSER